MDLVTFLEQNWFAITGILTLVGTAWKMSVNLSEYKTSVKEHQEELQRKSDEQDEKLDRKLIDMSDKINGRIDKLEDQFKDQEKHRIDGMERTRLIMDGVEATLVSLHNDGHNGPVTASLEAIDNYKSKKASQW